jgi:hypothetical protein
MKTITFDGATADEAEEKKAQWLSDHPDVIVQATRSLPLPVSRERYAKITYPVSIEVDYDDPN